MRKLRVLDVTLRDGGIVNNFQFGEKNMKTILKAIEDSKIDFIELGYLEKNTGTERGRTQFINETVIPKYFLTNKKPGVTYSVMFDYGKFDVDDLGYRQENGIDAIRFAFHKRNLYDVKPIYEKLIQKGYDVYMQPMVTLHYNDDELEELVKLANSLDIKGMYFVDTFGQMRQPDIKRLAYYFDDKLRKDLTLGFHSHNNIQMAYANTITFMQLDMDRNRMFDSSIMGMGRGAGNCDTELVLQHMNIYYGGSYVIPPLLNVMDTILSKIKAKYPWGYSVEYYLSSLNDCSPIYANHYYKKHMLPVEQINELLSMIEGEKRISFSKDYAEEKYREYNAKTPYDDSDTIEKLKKLIFNKNILVIAPGKSIKSQREKVEKVVNNVDLTITLNFATNYSDFVFFSRQDAFLKSDESDIKRIVVSNVCNESKDNIFIIDYLKWITIDDETRDTAGFLILKLLSKLEAKIIKLAGFDGFTSDINENYFDDSLSRAVSVDQRLEKNKVFSDYISNLRNDVNIEFITKSIYDV